MATAALLLTVDEYLHTSYQPDCDYVDGVIEERNLGEQPHSRIQFAFAILLSAFEQSLGIRVFPEQRVQTRLTRFRIPDLCVVLSKTKERIFRVPPFLCIEILSPEDRLPRVENRLKEYFEMGVQYVWVVDPEQHDAWIYTPHTKIKVADGYLTTHEPELKVSLEELFRRAEN